MLPGVLIGTNLSQSRTAVVCALGREMTRRSATNLKFVQIQAGFLIRLLVYGSQKYEGITKRSFTPRGKVVTIRLPLDLKGPVHARMGL